MQHLVILLHGYTLSVKRYLSLKEVIESSYPDAKLLIPPMDMKLLSMADPNDIVANVLTIIDKAWEDAIANREAVEELPKVIIIGHSAGAVIARKLYVVACGENPEATFENHYLQKTTRAWAAQVDRIILLAGMNRGWTISHQLYNKTALLCRVGIFVGNIFSFLGSTPFAFQIRRGAPFITQLRLQWLEMLQQADHKKVGNAPIIQLLGTKDDLISPEDTIDMVTGNNFIYLEVVESDHLSVLKMKQGPSGHKRSAIFTTALTADVEELRKTQVVPADPNFLQPDDSVTDVVFVIHGIRDTGYWTQKVARRVKAMGDKVGRKYATETSTYGYFAMLPFLFSVARRKKVAWLMDQYTENKALYPKATFSFMGHSNGTYLMAKALKEYPICRFKHVVFAGSVVPTNFNWSTFIEEKRIGKLFNLVATEDSVVAMFPKSFQVCRLSDLGSGGFDGFTDEHAAAYQIKFIKGGHGAATEEIFWDGIAHFIVHGEVLDTVATQSVRERPPFMKLIGATAPFPFLLLICLFMLMPVAVLVIYFSLKLALLMFFYFFLVWKIVTRI